jgi:hypothetical protein
MTALAADPDARISWSPDDLDRDQDGWDHLSTAAVMQAALERDAAPVPPLAVPLQPLLTGPVPTPGQLRLPSRDALSDDPQLGRVHSYAGRLIRLTHAAGISELDCHGADSRALLWRLRWPSDPQQPSRALALIDDTVVVAEGTAQLLLVDLGCGSLRGRLDCGELPADPARGCIAGATIAIPDPLNHELAIAAGLPSSAFAPAAELVAQLVRLPAALRWLAPVPPRNQVLARLEDGRAVLYPGGDAVQLPPAVLSGTVAPVLWDRGLAVADLSAFFLWSGGS